MAADLVLVQGLPGGPYRLDLTETPTGGCTFAAAEMCACPAKGGAPHWHDVTAAESLADLFVALLTRYLQGAPS
jgi:hypothetical protein